MLTLEQLSLMINEHLGLINCVDGIEHNNKWIIAESSLGGRGIIATQDIMGGEVLFVDHPLIEGPRSGTTVIQGCTVCKKIESSTFFKCPKCALLLCSELCQDTSRHYNDCAIISRWNTKVPIEEINEMELSRALTAIRSLVLNENQKQLMYYLQAHDQPQHGREIRELCEYFEIPEEEVDLILRATYALDTNAYEIPSPLGSNEMNRRGLYPVASLMNHRCIPNTRHSYNSDSQMTVKAVKFIRAGSEIFTCYTGLLWATPARRVHLYKTKHFWCKCDRCADPTELGTLLSALKCFASECSGFLLPIDPLKCSSSWRCLECGMRVPNSNICAVQNALGSMIGTIEFRNLGELENFLLNRIIKFVPKCNQIIVDLEWRLVWQLGECEGYRWHELPEARMSLKESLCRNTLQTLAALGAGDAHLRGLLLYHLHGTLAERARRCPALYEELKSEIESTIEQAYNILHGNISAPPDLELRRRYLGLGCNKPHEERFFILHSLKK